MVWLPNINPIENIWYSVKKKVFNSSQSQHRNYKTWADIDLNKCEGLVKSMFDRIKAIIKAKGVSAKNYPCILNIYSNFVSYVGRDYIIFTNGSWRIEFI